MRNTYIIRPKRGSQGLAQRVSEATAKLCWRPALLRPEEIQEFLAGTGHWNFQPFNGPLAVTPCESPLVKQKKPGTQQELF